MIELIHAVQQFPLLGSLHLVGIEISSMGRLPLQTSRHGTLEELDVGLCKVQGSWQPIFFLLGIFVATEILTLEGLTITGSQSDDGLCSCDG